MFREYSLRRDQKGTPARRHGLRGASAALLAALLAAGCGGGGGGSTGGTGSGPNNGPSDTGNGWLSFTPARTDVTTYAGETKFITITATSSKVIEGTFNVGIVDRAGVTTGAAQLTPSNPTTYVAMMQLSPSLAVGSFEGNFEVRLCRDDPQVCAQPIQGSPWQVPFKISVLKATNLTPLAPLAGAKDWTTGTGDASRNAYVNAQVQAERFNRRWALSDGFIFPSAEGGRILGRRWFGLAAVAEFDGAKLWERGEIERDWYSYPSVGDGQLWVLGQGHDPVTMQFVTQLIAYDAQTGQIRKEVPLEGQPPKTGRDYAYVGAPLVQSGIAYVATASGAVRRNSGANWGLDWLVTPTAEAQLPADRNGIGISLANGRVVGFDGARLWALNAQTGSNLLSVTATGNSSAFYRPAAPVLSTDDMAYVTTANRLIAFDLAAKSQRWVSDKTVTSNAVAKGALVYAIEAGNALVALDPASGKEQWRWTSPVPGATGGASLVVIGKYAFTSMGDVTYAIDVETQKLAWQYPMATSTFAVSPNGTLVLASLNSTVAINLR